MARFPAPKTPINREFATNTSKIKCKQSCAKSAEIIIVPAHISPGRAILPPVHGSDDAVNPGAMLLADNRLVLRVLRHWDDAGANRLFPSKSQIDPWVIGDDWANCALIDLHHRVERSTIVAVGSKL